MKPLKLDVLTDPKTGLSSAQAAKEKPNVLSFKQNKSISKILADHIFTYFNLVNIILAVLIATTGSYRNMMFMLAVIFSSGAGIYQEYKARRTLEKMAILFQPKYSVLRNGKMVTLASDQLVANDLIELKRGDQVPVDGVIISGSCSVNEGILTGESDGILKNKGDSLYSGSDLMSGNCMMQAVLVGDETFAGSMLKKATHFEKIHSPLKDGINSIIKICSLCILPAGIGLMIRYLYMLQEGWNTAVLSTSAALIGMIPEGLVVLSSLALLTAAARLSKKDVLVQQLYCLEGLAQADRLCMDKTGTVTTGELRARAFVPFEGVSENELIDVLKLLYGPLKDDNESAAAIWQMLETKESGTTALKPDEVMPFSSEYKYAQAKYGDQIIRAGAIGFAMDLENEDQKKMAADYMDQGMRVLVAGVSQDGNPFKPLGLILLSDTLRPDVKEILSFFKKQGIKLTIISGDSEKTIAAVARLAGMEGKAVNLSALKDFDPEAICMDYDIFGRATPMQKEALIKAWQVKGERCAMVGDGVNDLLALKKADCSIAMGSGSQAARGAAQMVLIKNQFERLPDIFHDGRRVVGNLQQAASLFLVKTIFSFGLCLLNLAWMEVYPFVPIQLTLISALFIGIPSFFLTFARTDRKVSPEFLRSVLSQALPGGIGCIIICIMAWILKGSLGWSDELYTTICSASTAIFMGINLYGLIFGSRAFRLFSVLVYEGLYFICAICAGSVFYFVSIPFGSLWVLAIAVILGILSLMIQPWLRLKLIK